MELLDAQKTAERIIQELEPFCDTLPNGQIAIEVVGSVRRKAKNVNDIVILIAPKGALLFELMTKLVKLGALSTKVEAKKVLDINHIKTEIWFTTPDKWPIMLLIRTGGEQNNRDIAKLCEKKGWHLSVSKGTILNKDGNKVKVFDECSWEDRDIQTEQDVFDVLGVKYVLPEGRK